MSMENRKEKTATEIRFSRVLVSSVLGILLCMVCMISTTWAWFATDVHSEGNTIEIAMVTPMVALKKGDTVLSPGENDGYCLETGMYSVGIQLESNASLTDDLNRSRGNMYVVMAVCHDGGADYYYFTFAGAETAQQGEIQVLSGTAAVNFSVSWVRPASAVPVGEDAVVVGQLPPAPTETGVPAESVAETRATVSTEAD